MPRINRLVKIEEALFYVRNLPLNDPDRLKVYKALEVGKRFVWLEQ